MLAKASFMLFIVQASLMIVILDCNMFAVQATSFITFLNDNKCYSVGKVKRQ